MKMLDQEALRYQAVTRAGWYGALLAPGPWGDCTLPGGTSGQHPCRVTNFTAQGKIFARGHATYRRLGGYPSNSPRQKKLGLAQGFTGQLCASKSSGLRELEISLARYAPDMGPRPDQPFTPRA
jgi:hypothetical protein